MRDPQATTRRHAMRSVREAARDSGVPEVTLRRWIAEGELFAVRLGPSALVDMGEVEALRDRWAEDNPLRRRGWSTGAVRAIGIGDVVAGVVGSLLFFGFGPTDLGSPWALALALVTLAVGVLLLWAAGSDARRVRA